MNYNQALDYIYGHTNYEAVPKPHAEDNYDLRRLYEILERLGNPHTRARSLHIAGTNGKGSTSAMLASILAEAGYQTGLYTSPHLISTRERIMVNGQMITEDELASIMTRLRPEIESANQKSIYGRLTVFEILTVLGFVYFSEKKCQMQVMEVGMGGRFDATNVIQPEVCLLTSISFDHTAILGNTLTSIATEKCGIIKPGCTVISHPQAEEADHVIQDICSEKGVNLIRVGREVTCKSLNYDFNHQEMEIEGRLDKYIISIPLLGHYQLDNAAAAVAAIEVLQERGYCIPKEALITGMAKVSFPGRMHILSLKPLIVADGGHNPGAARKLKETLLNYFHPENAILVIGISSDKDIPSIICELSPVFSTVIATRADSPRSAKPEIIAAEFTRLGIQTSIASSVSTALAEAKKIANEKDLICVTGSLYVVGEALEYIENYTGNH